MAGRVRTSGDCGYCGRELTVGGLTRHLRSCAARREAIEQADRGGRSVQDVYHLRAQGKYRPEYWLHLEMCGSATLEDLDHYLRRIWLECCGHLSQFNIGGMLYDCPGAEFPGVDPFFDEDHGSMAVGVDRLFAVGLAFSHEYDFGSTTHLTIKVLDQRRGRPTTGHPIALMARNIHRPPPCQACGEPARFLCLGCHYEGSDDLSGYVCEDDAAAHAGHEDYGRLPLVNSPRSGVCGYDGPGEPPW
ncbi:MAG: hypothetical protein OXU81_14645 [Gammaproteobacteria bacterium]|nr:hypothetical protein [Gammaproteobacteria bacterium]